MWPRDQKVTWFWRQQLLIINQLPLKFSKPLACFACHRTSCDHMINGSHDYVLWSLIMCHHPVSSLVAVGVFEGEILLFISHMISHDQVIKISSDLRSRPLSWAITVSSLVAINLWEVVIYCFLLVAWPHVTT